MTRFIGLLTQLTKDEQEAEYRKLKRIVSIRVARRKATSKATSHHNESHKI